MDTNPYVRMVELERPFLIREQNSTSLLLNMVTLANRDPHGFREWVALRRGLPTLTHPAKP